MCAVISPLHGAQRSRAGCACPTSARRWSGLLLAVGIVATLVAIVSQGRYVGIPEARVCCDWPATTRPTSPIRSVDLKAHRPDGVPVYVLGGSAMREATSATNRSAAALTIAPGSATEAYTLAGNEQSFAHDRAIVENLPAPVPTAPSSCSASGSSASCAPRLLEAWRGGRRGSPDRRRRDGLARRRRTGWPARSGGLARELSRYASTYLREHAGELLTLDLPSHPFVAHATPRTMPGARRASASRLDRWYGTPARLAGTFDQVFPATRRDLQRTVSTARERGFTVVLVEQPYDLAGGRRQARPPPRSRARPAA